MAPTARSEVTPDGYYFVRPVRLPEESGRRDGLPRWVQHQFNRLPVVVDAAGAPWAEAQLYVVLRLENTVKPNMATFEKIARDLVEYRRWLDEHGVDWTLFPKQKLFRPTYRYNAYLRTCVRAGELSATLAKRRMASVIGFYRWLTQPDESRLALAHRPWEDKDIYIEGATDSRGVKRSLVVKSTDLHLQAPRQDDVFDGTIQDGGRLRPLPANEQEWLVDALMALANTEMTYIHLLSWLSGARLQSVLTFRVKNVVPETPAERSDVRIPIGFGTLIDTKRDKQMVLHLPVWFYERLRIYALSERARARRRKSRLGDVEEQMLFLSAKGSVLYQPKKELEEFDAHNTSSYRKTGQAVQNFVLSEVVPHVRHAQRAPRFHYRFHDLRATYGMNETQRLLRLVEAGQIRLSQVRDFVRTRMGHTSYVTTDQYLNFVQHQQMAHADKQAWEDHLKVLSDRAMRSSDV